MTSKYLQKIYITPPSHPTFPPHLPTLSFRLKVMGEVLLPGPAQQRHGPPQQLTVPLRQAVEETPDVLLSRRSSGKGVKKREKELAPKKDYDTTWVYIM